MNLCGRTGKTRKPLTSSLTAHDTLPYSSPHLHFRPTHIAPHARYEAHHGTPRTGAGARPNSHADGKQRQQHDLFNKGASHDRRL